MTYAVYLLRTVTGEVGSRIDVPSGSWSIELNKTESGSIKARKPDLAKRGKEWWAPRSGGVLFTFTDSDGVEHPVAGGPITGWSSETAEELTLDWKGPRYILANRILTENLTLTGISLGTIAWRLVKHSMDSKPAGGLPIVHGQDEETAESKADHTRTYEQWNVSNNGYDKRLTELSEVINGPDIMFRPRWADADHRRVEWVMVHGTEANPRIGQAVHLDFDTTAALSDLSDLAVTSEAGHVVNRVWATGSGEGNDTYRQYVDDFSSLQDMVPFTEKVVTDSDAKDDNLLRRKAEGELAVSKQMLDQLTLSVRADARKNPLGTYHVGDVADVWLTGWFSIPDGRHQMRIIAMSGGLDGKVKVDFQKESWG